MYDGGDASLGTRDRGKVPAHTLAGLAQMAAVGPEQCKRKKCVTVTFLWKMSTVCNVFEKVYLEQRKERRQLLIFEEVDQIFNNFHLIYSSLKKLPVESINSQISTSD